ncbi:MAG: Zn-ribbon domain-containing OB-fold protein [Alphaproteobacteria bacterium]|nr:Zn-ribbon domain-containing OB-fold protein [Alphaproteobacteria bacterium]
MSGEPPYRGALPRPTPETRPYWDGAKAGRLMLPWCKACARPHFYPRSICPHCGAADLEWRQASGRGTVYSYVINHKPARGFEDKVPYVIAVIALAEGPRMLTNLVTDTPTPEAIRIDMPVEVVFDAVTPEITLPKFRPVEAPR